MTLYVSFRQRDVGGGVAPPRILEGKGDTASPSLRDVAPETIPARVAGKNVVFAVHGFNVSREDGTRALGRLEPLLQLGSGDIFVGVLWPGDFWVPVINYPFEGEDAKACGKRLALFCRQHLKAAASLSFVSHSLGARLVLEAVKTLDRRAKMVCLTAAAVDRDCLTREYSTAFANAEVVSVLASHGDNVLRLAYPAGDFFAGIWGDHNDVFQTALGYNGPPTPLGATRPPWQIDDSLRYGHDDYLPPGTRAIEPQRQQAKKWEEAAGFMRRGIRREPQTWPA